MSYKICITREIICELFEYNPIEGTLYSKNRKRTINFNTMQKQPLVSVRTSEINTKIAAHSIIWLITHGKWPESIIFHRDFDEFNLKLTNLIEVDRLTNYALITAYKNLTEYCDIKSNPNDRYSYVVRYLADGRMRYEQHHDMKFAQEASNRLKEEFKRTIIKMGGIPPV